MVSEKLAPGDVGIQFLLHESWRCCLVFFAQYQIANVVWSVREHCLRRTNQRDGAPVLFQDQWNLAELDNISPPVFFEMDCCYYCPLLLLMFLLLLLPLLL